MLNAIARYLANAAGGDPAAIGGKRLGRFARSPNTSLADLRRFLKQRSSDAGRAAALHRPPNAGENLR